jgi:hypothetical protein
MDTAEPKDVVAATAAYAAVLVVFVRTSIGTSSASNSDSLNNGAIAGIVVSCTAGILLLILTCGGLCFLAIIKGV